ncbi:hypothetical protein WR25_23304 [Diploscapter pachys]|uniref:Ig-like domain-containing protein n=1 Tax=Diploscapter pachys TaxID=2018661 RepID=A0A2A2J7B2_9BILA|nr:hypothetical protein WR25_23304 [Diploscapter pachys]
MRLLLLLLTCCSISYCDSEGPPPLMQRVMSTIPDLPNAISGQMNGDSGALNLLNPYDVRFFRGMISKMLGDGLLSQLVTDPKGVAQHMGFSLDDISGNQTKPEGPSASFIQEPNSTNSKKNEKSKQFLDQILQSFTLSPPVATTTLRTLLIDGNTVPPEMNDRLIRKYNWEGKYATMLPPTTTTRFSPEQMAEMVASKLAGRGMTQETVQPKFMPAQDFARSYSSNLVDPKSVEKYNNDLRRWPTTAAFGVTPVPVDPLTAPIDPTVNEVLTNMRTRGLFGMTVEEVKRLQAMLQTYEQTLQTNELLAKRKQLQVLQDELEEQRKRIETQRKMEEELRKKEKELEEAKAKMERQLREQLSNWHRSFNPKQNAPAPPLDLADLGLSMSPTSSPIPQPPASFPISVVVDETTTQLITTTEKATIIPPKPTVVFPEREFRRSPKKQKFKHQEDEQEIDKGNEDSDENDQEHEYRRMSRIGSLLRNQRRYSSIPTVKSTELGGDQPRASENNFDANDEEFYSSCECEKISLDRMKGVWTMVLASAEVVDALERRASVLVNSDQKINLNCSRFEVSSSKQSAAAQDARIVWEFRVDGSRKLNRFQGNALSMDHKTVRIQLKDNSGELNNIPVCTLKADGRRDYEYLVVTNGQGNCRDAALLVRDPEHFFDDPDTELENFLKNKMIAKELEPIDVISFADDFAVHIWHILGSLPSRPNEQKRLPHIHRMQKQKQKKQKCCTEWNGNGTMFRKMKEERNGKGRKGITTMEAAR